MSLPDDLTLALSIADAADEVTTARFGALDLFVESKPDNTPVSDADTAVETLVRTRLGAERPLDGVLGEEEGETGVRAMGDAAGGPSRRWVLDPIDGTKNFVRGVPVWGTLLALEVDGAVVLGVVSAPALGRRWWATLGGGAWVTDPLARTPRRLAVSRVGALADASLSYSSLHGWGPRLPAFTGLMTRFWRTRAYSDFWSYMLVAEGAVDVAAEPEVSRWDLAALDIVVREAGGRFTDLAGAPGPGGGSAVASNGLLHDEVLSRLA